MLLYYYDVALALSLLLSCIYVFLWHKHFDAHITVMFVLAPIANLGFVLLAHSKTLEAALAANCLIYLGGCYLMLFVVFIVFGLCDIKLNRYLRMGMVFFSTAIYMSVVMTGDHFKWFYKSVTLERVNGVSVLTKEYGFMHTVFIVMMVVYFGLSVGAIVYSLFKKNQVSRKNIYLLLIPAAVSMLAFFLRRSTVRGLDLTPMAFSLGLIVYLVIVWRLCLYDVTDTAVDTLTEEGETGLASFDFKYRYLASNDAAKAAFPEFTRLTVDHSIRRNKQISETVLTWLTEFSADNTKNKRDFERDGKSYLIVINYLFDGNRKRGYQLFITDETQSREYIKLLGSYNEELQREVDRKTAHVIEMHDNLIMSMAAMVEGRDNSTGGHIRRTSEGVRLIVEEMKKDNAFGISEEFSRDIIKAAPMHDLGKITVDDAILRKPGRYTPEEYAVMKTHAAEGARIVREILRNTDDRTFARIAENVAHYHHERIDGSGYPEGLRGDQIPLEARIMAIADVYDALVSKRVYKEKMTFEQAHEVIKEGMGSQFDPALYPYYIAARPKLEEYYKKLEEQGAVQ